MKKTTRVMSVLITTVLISQSAFANAVSTDKSYAEECNSQNYVSDNVDQLTNENKNILNYDVCVNEAEQQDFTSNTDVLEYSDNKTNWIKSSDISATFNSAPSDGKTIREIKIINDITLSKNACLNVKDSQHIVLESQSGNKNICINGKTTKSNMINISKGGELTIGGGNESNILALKGNNKNNESVISNDGTLYIKDGIQIIENKARLGGGIYNMGKIYMHGGIIQNNTATTRGGAIYNRGELDIIGGIMQNNKVSTGKSGADTGYGGGICNSSEGTTNIYKVTIKNNYAGTYGGGIYNHGKLNIKDAIIEQNNAEFGGGICNEKNSVINMYKGTIKGNEARRKFLIFTYFGDGGGIYNWGTLNIAGGTIENNKAKDSGGGIYNNHGKLNIREGTIIKNNKPTNIYSK